MITEIAKVVSWTNSETECGHIQFDMKLLADNRELMGMYVELRNRYEEVAVAAELKRIADLEENADLKVLEYRSARESHSRVKDEDFFIRQRHATAQNAVRQASVRYDGLRSAYRRQFCDFRNAG